MLCNCRDPKQDYGSRSSLNGKGFMKVRLIYNETGLGKTGDVIDVDAVRGNDMHCKGECEVIEHDKPRQPDEQPAPKAKKEK